MKLLLALAISTQIFLAGPCLAKNKGAKPAPAADAAATTAMAKPETPRERTPGFWERSWVSAGKLWGSTKKAGSGVGNFVTAPFRHHDPNANAMESGWRKLSMSMVLSPANVKLPQDKSVGVSVSVVNTGTDPVQLEFPNSERIEVLIKDDSGKVLSKWSEDQKLAEEEGFLVINPGEKLDYTATISTREMAAGKTYLIEAFFPKFDELRASRTVVPTK